MLNLFADIPATIPEEIMQTHVTDSNLRIERIVSLGHSSPDGFWFDQDKHEWVIS